MRTSWPTLKKMDQQWIQTATKNEYYNKKWLRTDEYAPEEFDAMQNVKIRFDF